jgi:hypothetical protein
MSHRRRALAVITAALVLDAGCGLWFAAAQHISWWLGLYCAVANAVTVGGTVAPSAPGGYLATAAECVLVVPLFAATFSLFTSGLTAVHVAASEERIKEHVELRLRHHCGKPAPSGPVSGQ